jgi:putative toxin-antitoxin system antitoxin component (TIGR02293 family)
MDLLKPVPRKTDALAGPVILDSLALQGNSRALKGGPLELIAIMRKGSPARTLPKIAAKVGVSQDKLLDFLRLPKSTLKGRISADRKLSPAEQDRVYRVERVLARSLEVLENEGAAKTWLNQNNRSLGGEIPLALLDTEVGYELVLDTLGRIQYGVIS